MKATSGRKMDPAFVGAIEKVRPAVLLLENVRGMMYRGRWYFVEIIERVHDLGYLVEYRLLRDTAPRASCLRRSAQESLPGKWA